MHNSKLFQLLCILEASEIRWLHKFLKSPYHNSNHQYVQLFEYIKKYYPDLKHPKLSKETAYKKIFPKENFDAQKVRKLMHELAVLVEEFLVVHPIKNNALERQKLLIQELGRRNDYQRFEKEANLMLSKLEKTEKHSEDHFLEQYLLRRQLIAHPLMRKQQDNGKKILMLSKELDFYYVRQKLNLACNLEATRRIYTVQSELTLLEAVQNELKEGGSSFGKVLEIRLYHLIYQLLANRRREDLFEKAYLDFIENKASLEQRTKEILLKHLISYTTYHLNKGKQQYVFYNFKLHKIGLQEGLFIEANRMSDLTFSNIVGSGAFLKEFDWIKVFIEHHQQYLDETIRSEVLGVNQANIALQEGYFHKAIDLLSTLSFNKILYRIQSRLLAVKAYFELYLQDNSYHELSIAQIKAFEKFIRREQQIAANSEKSLLNFSSVLKRLIAYNNKASNLRNLRNEIERMEFLSNRPWLLEKQMQLSGRFLGSD